MSTEEPEDVEREDQLPGAKANDMNKWQVADVRNWLDDDQKHMADAKKEFDTKLMDGDGGGLSTSQELLSGRIFDTLIGSPTAKDRGWKILELMPHSCHRWIPWGTLEDHYTEGGAWNVKLTDE
eukprot:16424255-Heterocapsa_arctica.AAC.1